MSLLTNEKTQNGDDCPLPRINDSTEVMRNSEGEEQGGSEGLQSQLSVREKKKDKHREYGASGS